MPWYLFALATPAFYAAANLFDKYLLGKKIKDPIAIVVLAGISSGILGVVIGVLNGFKYIGLDQTVIVVFAGIILIFYMIPYFSALQKDDASSIVPLFQFTPVFTLILSSLILHETLASKQIYGLLLVVIASFVLEAEKLDFRIFVPRKAFWLMILASLMLGTVAILFRFVVKEEDFWTTLSYEYIGTGIAALILLALRKTRRRLSKQRQVIRKSFVLITIPNLLAIIAQMSESYAFSLVAVPLVNVIEGLQPLMVLTFATLLSVFSPHIIKETINKRILLQKSGSILLIFCGMYLVYF